MNNVLQTVRQTLTERRLLQRGDCVLVALSGGADSVCLLSVLSELQDELSLTVCAAHLHHGLRGEEADADESFVRSLCRARRIPLFVRRADIRAAAKKAGIGLEEAGRQARYAFFEELRQTEGIDKIATAHHADDNIETVLMRFLRGTGPNGLAGIPYQNGFVVRPLLDVSRHEIEAYIAENSLSYRTDSTNFETEFTRNKIRHRLVPTLEKEYNPGLRQTLQTQIGLYECCAAFLREETEQRITALSEPTDSGYRLKLRPLAEQPPFMIGSILHTLLSRLEPSVECGASAVQAAEKVLKKGQGSVRINSRVMVAACYSSFYLRLMDEPIRFCHSVVPQGTFIIPETGQKFVFSHVAAVPEMTACNCAYIKPDMLAHCTAEVRSRREGDYFYPQGMTGKKTLKRFFMDAKIPQFLRSRVPLLTLDGEIAWVAGRRIDRRFAAERGNAALCITFYEGANHV